jgi:hypothetical protein
MLEGLRATEPRPPVDSTLLQAMPQLCHKTSLAPLPAKALVLPAFRVIKQRYQQKKMGHLYRTRCVLRASFGQFENRLFLVGQQYLARY